MRTLFVTGGTGFIGGAFVRRATAASWRVRALSRGRAEGEARLLAAGAEVVPGDLLAAPSWGEAARAADAVVHLAQPETFGARVTLRRARRYQALRLRMDAALLDALGGAGGTAPRRRVLYVCGTNYYGDQGAEPRGEDTPPQPRGWGRYVAPAVEALERWAVRGAPIVEAFPGWVYGAGSWFAEYVLRPLRRGWPLTVVAGPERLVPPVHVDDCAAALLHLVEHGEPGRRYFVVDDRPTTMRAMVERAARTMRVKLRLLRAPAWLYRALLGPVVTESQTYDCNLRNARLRGTGWAPAFPTIDEGVPAAVDAWLAKTAR